MPFSDKWEYGTGKDLECSGVIWNDLKELGAG